MKLAMILIASLVLVGCQNTPVINQPYTVDSINKHGDTAIVHSGELKLEIEFDANYFNDGNGVGHNWRDVEINQVKEVKVFDKNDNEIESYVLTSDQVSILVDDIENFIREVM